MDFDAFKRTIVDTLDKYAPLNKKYLTANHSNFVTKELSKAIMNRSRLRNQFLKNRSIQSRMKYNKQINICVALLRKTKRKYYEDLRLSDVNDNKKFWKTAKRHCLEIKSSAKAKWHLLKVTILSQMTRY